MLHKVILVFARRIEGTIEVTSPLQPPSAPARETGRRDGVAMTAVLFGPASIAKPAGCPNA